MRHLQIACAFAAAAAAASTASAQKNEAKIRSDIEFARGLAGEWSFVDLAESVIRDVESSGASGKVAEELALAKCEIYFVAAQSNAARREELLKKAIGEYESFVARNATSSLLEDAEAGLVKAASFYARALALKLEDAVGDEATALKEEIQATLTRSVSKVTDLADRLLSIKPDERSEAERRKLGELLLAKGEMLLELAKAQDDGTFSFQQSLKAFERLNSEAGEGSPAGLRAFIGIGDNYSAQGEYVDAAGFYEFVVNYAIPRDRAAWDAAVKEQELSTEDKQGRFLFVQIGTPGLVRSLALSGETAAAADWGLHFYNVWKREGLDLVQPVGDLALLAVARTLVDAGGYVGGNLNAGDVKWYATQEEMAAEQSSKRNQRTALEVALTIAQQVNEQNKGNTLQIRAQKVISEIISRPGVKVDPEILLEASLGEYNDQNYAAAIASLRRVQNALRIEDVAKRREMMPRLLFYVGRSFQRLDRPLEAAVTFEHALDQWSGDPQWDPENARQFMDTMTALKRAARGDPLIEAMWSKSEREMADKGSGTQQAEIAFRQAQRLYDEEKFPEAKPAYDAVQASAPSYEKALVFSGVCSYRMGQLDEAARIFDDYLNRYVHKPENQTNDATRLAKRAEATATAYFYWGLTAFKQAEASGNWQRVVELLGDYHTRFPAQSSFAPAALYRVLVAHSKLGESEKVKGVLVELLTHFPDNRWTGMGAKESYDILKARYDAEQDAAKKKTLLREMAENLQTVNKTSQAPTFNNVRAESKHWIELGEWAIAEELLIRLRDKFSSTNREDVEKFVIPDLGEVYNRQFKVRDAAAVLRASVDAKTATRPAAANFAAALTGWLIPTEESQGRYSIREVPGVGGEEFQRGCDVWNQLADAAEKWTAEWYAYKLGLIYGYYAWGKIDGKKTDVAKNQLAFLVQNLGGSLKHEHLEEPTRQCFLWLLNATK